MGWLPGTAGDDIPRSLMFRTPAALELCLLWLIFPLGGEDERPCTAESTLVSGSDMMICVRDVVGGAGCLVGKRASKLVRSSNDVCVYV